MSSVFFLTLGYSSSKGSKIPTGFLGHQYTLIFALQCVNTLQSVRLQQHNLCFSLFLVLFLIFCQVVPLENPLLLQSSWSALLSFSNFCMELLTLILRVSVQSLLDILKSIFWLGIIQLMDYIVVTTFVNSFTNSFLVICSDGLVICCGLLELMWARYSFEWFRLVFTRALIPCLTLRVLPQLTWIEEFPLVCSPILVLYPHTSRASITLQLLKVPLHHSKCVFLHVSCCCSNVRDQARAPSYPYSSGNQLTSKHECSKLNKR